LQKDFYICVMRYFLFFLIAIQFSCGSKKEESLQQTVSGNWFILYPKDELTNSKQEKIYADIQDSLTALKCLKLISFSEKGVFNQLDSIKIKGKWGTKDEMYVRVTDGGRGFDDFRTTFDGFDNGILKLTEIVNSGGEKLKFVWHLMKIDKGDPTKLFEPAYNKWRIKPTKPESDEEIKNRLVQMLNFYSIYFKLIADNSSYFIPGRIILPFKFYQHGIGMKFFDEQSVFASLFYSKEQAKAAHLLLDITIGDVEFGTQNLKSYTEEYSIMLKKIGEVLMK
jgi:hypothetical protein